MQPFNPTLVATLVAEPEDEELISCYLPLERAGRDTRQNAIQIGNLLRRLETALRAKGRDKRSVAGTVDRLGTLLGAEPPAHLRQNNGLALFASADECRVIGCRAQFVPRLAIAPRYDVLPLLPLVDGEVRGAALVLGRQNVRIVEVTADGAAALELPADFPRALTDAVGTELRERSLQHHAVGGGAAVFHGHGEGEDDVLPELETFCHRVGAALAGLPRVAGLPIVVAADVKLAAVFRRSAPQLDVLDATIAGNYEHVDDASVGDLARPLLARAADGPDWAREFHARRAEARASDSQEDVRRAARDARVAALLVERGAALDGLDGSGEEPLFNAEAVLTLRHGGEAHLLAAHEMPTRAPMAAIYRF